jgi:hypothetical protein
MTFKSVAIGSQSAKFFEGLIDRHFPQWDFLHGITSCLPVIRPESATNADGRLNFSLANAPLYGPKNVS